jgi:hypothetical protein
LYGRDPVIFAAALGGWAVLAAAVIGAGLLLRKKQAGFPSALIVCWFALLAFATYQASRFMYYALPPVSLLAGIALHKAAEEARSRIGPGSWKRVVLFCLALLAIGTVMLPYLLQSQRAMLPKMNDAITSVGESIDKSLPADSPIISWWDYGHFWRYAAKREPYLQGRQQEAETGQARVWLAARAFLAHNSTEAKNIWTILMCEERGWINSRISTPGLFAQPHSCAAPREAAVVVDEEMLALATNMLEAVIAQDSSFAAGPAWVSPVRQCAQGGSALLCGDLRVDLSTLSAAEGKQVHLYQNGTRSGTKASGDVAVVYETASGYAAFATSGWLAETMLVRMFAGERFGMEPLAVAEDPIRAVAYRFRQG